MASREETVAAVDDTAYPLADGELEQEIKADTHDTVPPPKKPEKEIGEAGRKEDKDGKHNLKSTLLLSGAVVAVIGAIFAVAKKMREG